MDKLDGTKDNTIVSLCGHIMAKNLFAEIQNNEKTITFIEVN